MILLFIISIQITESENNIIIIILPTILHEFNLYDKYFSDRQAFSLFLVSL